MTLFADTRRSLFCCLCTECVVVFFVGPRSFLFVSFIRAIHGVVCFSTTFHMHMSLSTVSFSWGNRVNLWVHFRRPTYLSNQWLGSQIAIRLQAITTFLIKTHTIEILCNAIRCTGYIDNFEFIKRDITSPIFTPPFPSFKQHSCNNCHFMSI